MLDIAICDDDSIQLEIITSFTREYVQSHHIEATVQQFLHPDTLLKRCEKQRFNLYILDIVMPMFSGIEVGKIVREQDPTTVILYTTCEPGFALQSFAAKPFDYLLKPIEKQQFMKTLHLAITHTFREQARTWAIKAHEGLIVLTLSEIMYCEYSEHRVAYMLEGARTITTQVIKESFARHVEGLLQNGCFVQPHVSFVVNMSHVVGFRRTNFILRDGTLIPIVTKHYRAVRDIYMNYLANQGQV